MAVITRGVDSKSYGGTQPDTTDAINIPAGTVVGDWVYILGHATSNFTVTKPGFTRVAVLEPVYNGLYRGYAEVWVGQLVDLTPISYTYRINAGGVAGGSATVLILTSPNRPNLSRVATVTSATDEFILPGVRGSGAGAIALGAGVHGVGSTTWAGSASFPSPGTFGAYYVAAVDTSDAAVLSAEPSAWAYTSGDTGSAMVVIGVGGFADPAPCRLFPRSDGLGVGGGRNYPPPKSQQRSSRGVGYY